MTHLLPLPLFHGSTAPRGPRPRYHGFTIQRVKYTTLGRNTLDERLARRRDLYLTTHNTHKGEASMPSAGFESTVTARGGRRPTPLTASPLGRLHLPLFPLLPFHGQKPDASFPHFLPKFSLHRPDVSPFSKHRNNDIT